MNRWLEMDTPHCQITIEPRIAHCTRGRYIAKVFPRGDKCVVNEQSGWPRYYFTLVSAMGECELWLRANTNSEPMSWHMRELPPGAEKTRECGVMRIAEPKRAEAFLATDDRSTRLPE